MVKELAKYTTPQQFKEGLGFLLKGITGELETESARPLIDFRLGSIESRVAKPRPESATI